jgi:glutamate--cysteine ligase catalytic subunit
MGFLNVKGGVLTYNEYKNKIHTYKQHGLSQFKSLYVAHKDRYIPLKDLKWGEEMEYQIYKNDKATNQIKLSTRGPELINTFNESPLSQEKEIILMPEFGSWMIEAVPSKPYNSIIDAAELLSCEEKLHDRRETLDKFF